MSTFSKADYDAYLASKSAPKEPAQPANSEDQLINKLVAEKGNDPGVKSIMGGMADVQAPEPVVVPQPEPLLVSPAWTKDFGLGTTAAKDYLAEKTTQAKDRAAEVGAPQAASEVKALSDQGLLPPAAAIKPVTQVIERAEIEKVGLDNLLSQAIQTGDQARINELQRIAGEMYQERDASVARGEAQPDSGVTVGGVFQGAGKMLADTAQGGFEILQGVGTDLGYRARGAMRQLNPKELEYQARNKAELNRAIPYAGGSVISGSKALARGITDLVMNASDIPEWQQDVGLAMDRAKDLAMQDMVAQGTGELGDKTLQKMQSLNPTVAGADENKVRRMGDTTALGVTLVAPNAAFGLVDKVVGLVSKGTAAAARGVVGAAERVVPGTAKAVERVTEVAGKATKALTPDAARKFTKRAENFEAQAAKKLEDAAKASKTNQAAADSLKKEADALTQSAKDARGIAESVNPDVSGTRQAVGGRLAQVGNNPTSGAADQIAGMGGNRVMSRIGRSIPSAIGGSVVGAGADKANGGGVTSTITGAVLGGLGGMIGRGGMTAVRRKIQEKGVDIISGASKQGALSKIIERGAKGSVPGAAAAYGMTASDWDRMTSEDRNAVIGGGMAIGGIVNQFGQKKAPASDTTPPAPEPVAPKPAGPEAPPFQLEQETTQGPPAPRIEQGELPLDSTPAPVVQKPAGPEWNLPLDSRGEPILQVDQANFAVDLSRDIPRLQERIAAIPEDAPAAQLAKRKFWESELATKQSQLKKSMGGTIQLPGEAGSPSAAPEPVAPAKVPAKVPAKAAAPVAEQASPVDPVVPPISPMVLDDVAQAYTALGNRVTREVTARIKATAEALGPNATTSDVLRSVLRNEDPTTITPKTLQAPKALNPANPEPVKALQAPKALNPANPEPVKAPAEPKAKLTPETPTRQKKVVVERTTRQKKVVVERTPEEKAKARARGQKMLASFEVKDAAAKAAEKSAWAVVTDKMNEGLAKALSKQGEASRLIREKAEKSGITQSIAQNLLDADKTPKGKLEDPFDKGIQPLRNQVYKALGGEPLGNKQPTGQQVSKLLIEKFGSIEEARTALKSISNKPLDPKSGLHAGAGAVIDLGIGRKSNAAKKLDPSKS